MLFTSFSFAVLVIVTLAVYYSLTKKNLQVALLIIASLIFYGKNQPWLLFLLIISVFINALASWYAGIGPLKQRKIAAILGVSANLLLLTFFKYAGLLTGIFTSASEMSEVEKFITLIPLPVGISFYTFQGISLVVDVYRNPTYLNNWGKRNFIEYLQDCTFFKVFFPQLIAGPVVKAHDFMPQIGLKKLNDVQWDPIVRNLIVGYFLKMVIADNLKDISAYMKYPIFSYLSTIDLVLLIFTYSMQIFADFAGYSLIAIGISRMFGYNLIFNFDFPYTAKSFADFWRRWHISLSSWLKEYLYYSLGGNRVGYFTTLFNLMVVMALGGLWHGAKWSYMIWGGVHGALLILERVLNGVGETFKDMAIFNILKRISVFIMVSLAWLFFQLPELNHVVSYFNSLASNFNHTSQLYFLHLYIYTYGSPVILYHLHGLTNRQSNHNTQIIIRNLLLGLMLLLIVVSKGNPGTFIYFRF
jgi:alginate O-acetyltransferase complex protein AlgI